MKKLVSAIAFAAAASIALADGETANVLGVLRVDSAEKQTIVAVPWVSASASGNAPISVADIVKTDNLNEGDRLCAYENGAYKVWILSTEGGKHWEPTNDIQVGGISSSGGAADATIARGGALLLIRDNPASCFFLVGQYTSAAAGTVNLPAGAWSLVAPPSTTDFNLNSATWSTPNAADRITIKNASGNMVRMKYDGGQWKGRDMGDPSSTWSTAAAVIPAGCGAWYQNAGASAVTVTF